MTSRPARLLPSEVSRGVLPSGPQGALEETSGVGLGSYGEGMMRTRESDVSTAYPVPWRVERVSDSHPLVVNSGSEPAEAVRVFRSDGSTAHWGSLAPGETLDVCVCDADLDTVIVTLCWFRRSTGVEYAWRFVM